ncbi:MAG: SCO7613 C-terminal domain-containing membrane protein, partial [Angustibacter sp.]
MQPGPTITPAHPWLTPAAVPAARAAALGGATVPKILLGLGAILLLIAALTFLAFAWSWLGVDGRTAILVALTGACGGAGFMAVRRQLRLAAEAFATLTFGFLILDIAGAGTAGWLGDRDWAQVLTLAGGVLALAAGACVLATRNQHRLRSPEVAILLGLWVLAWGAAAMSDRDTPLALGTCLGFIALAYAARRLPASWLPWLAALSAVFWWLNLLGRGVSRVLAAAGPQELWLRGQGWPLLLAALLALVPAHRLRRRDPLPALLTGFAAVLLTPLLALSTGEGNGQALTLTGLTVAYAVALLLVPARWLWAASLPLACAVVIPAATALAQLTRLLARIAQLGPPWSQDAGLRLADAAPNASPWQLALWAAAALLVLVAFGRWAITPQWLLRRYAVPMVAWLLAGALAMLAGYPVPVALVLAGVLLLVLGLALWSQRGELGMTAGQRLGLTAVLPLVGWAGLLSLPSVVLTLITLLVVTGVSGWLTRCGPMDLRAATGTALPGLTAGLIWTCGELITLPGTWRGLLVLVVCAAVILRWPRLDWELSSALSAIAVLSPALLTAGSGWPPWLAGYLTLAGAVACASALLHSTRRRLGWLSGVLLSLASWVRLADFGIGTPEAYTLPSAVALLVFGYVKLKRPVSSWSALAPGLLLALLPSLQVLNVRSPASLRGLLLGLGCLMLMGVGVHFRL